MKTIFFKTVAVTGLIASMNYYSGCKPSGFQEYGLSTKDTIEQSNLVFVATFHEGERRKIDTNFVLEARFRLSRILHGSYSGSEFIAPIFFNPTSSAVSIPGKGEKVIVFAHELCGATTLWRIIPYSKSTEEDINAVFNLKRKHPMGPS